MNEGHRIQLRLIEKSLHLRFEDPGSASPIRFYFPYYKYITGNNDGVLEGFYSFYDFACEINNAGITKDGVLIELCKLCRDLNIRRDEERLQFLEEFDKDLFHIFFKGEDYISSASILIYPKT